VVRFSCIEATHRPGFFIAVVLVVKWRSVMGKYVLGWLLGVPLIVLVIIYC